MNKPSINDLISERIILLDGGLGTMVQACGLRAEDYHGQRFAGWAHPLAGCNDVLVLTAPHIISGIHRAYLEAGSDIVTTDTFNANAISLADYGLSEQAYEINYEAARIARAVADEYTLSDPSKPRYVGGSIGPTSRTASMSADVSDPAAREVTFDDLVEAYSVQAAGLIDGGAEVLFLETVFDTLNAKAGIFAIKRESEKRGVTLPLIISGTLADASGRTLSGQTVEAFYASVSHAEPLAVGFNCAYGARQLKPYLERLSAISRFAVSAYPNAGLPNVMGGYDETPAMMAEIIGEYAREGIVNFVGGCCGTTPDHIKAFSQAVAGIAPRKLPADTHQTVLSGLEPLRVIPENNFVNIGERANVAGSAKFARLIREGDYEQALSIARQQVESGAQIVDVCMDDGMIDGAQAMRHFLNLAASEPEIARVPFMIDSSSWETLEAGLKCVQGKSVVNSISLKEGEREFLRRARMIRDLGAAAVVMLFDEKGQADVYARKIEVAGRAYRVLTEDGFPPEDIIFDPNVLAVATGMEEHDRYGLDFIEACRWIKANLPHAKVSGGVSNLSFSFRGNNPVREALHSVFLYHAIAAGLDMAIVNPAMLQVYSEIEPELLELAEDAVLARRPDAGERLTAYASGMVAQEGKAQDSGKQLQWRTAPVAERIAYAMKKGVTDHIEEDTREAYAQLGSPLAVIDGMLMPAMSEIGGLFAEGKMFLPQIVKSARVMKKAVDVLTPFMEQQSAGEGAGKVLVATVKGDVHDIGKNIVSVVMACNGYQVTDLGVMVDAGRIADEAQRTGAQAVGLSGLISPSLDEMINVVREFNNRGIKVPVFIGGATTSALHTAVKIAPNYDGMVIHARDASDNITILNNIFGPAATAYIHDVQAGQEKMRDRYNSKDDAKVYLSLDEARRNRYRKNYTEVIPPRRIHKVRFIDYPIREVIPFIDWSFFFPAWEMKGKFPEILDDPAKGPEARRLFADARRMLEEIADKKLVRLNGMAEIYPARGDVDDIVIKTGAGKELKLPQLRNQEAGRQYNLCLADYVVQSTEYKDYLCAFAVTAGIGLDCKIREFRDDGDHYGSIMLKLLADRLTEAFAEAVHLYVRRELWGYETQAHLDPEAIIAGKYEGARFSFGYPACPDHSLKKELLETLDPEGETGMSLTENYMIAPAESVCGLIFAGERIRQFSVGLIDSQQVGDCARRRHMSPEQVRRLIPKHLRD